MATISSTSSTSVATAHSLSLISTFAFQPGRRLPPLTGRYRGLGIPKPLFTSQTVSSQPSLPFGQLQLEIRARHLDFPTFLKWRTEFEEEGLRPFLTEPDLIYANYNRSGPSPLAEVRFVCVFRGVSSFNSQLLT